MREGGSGAPARGEEGGGGGHEFQRQGRRSWSFARCGALKSKQRVPGERGGVGKLDPSLDAAGERSKRHAPWPAAMELSGERGQGR